MRIVFHGVVQGVGFRPAIVKIANDLGLAGSVRNTGSNVEVIVDSRHDDFIRAVKANLPPLARVDKIEEFDDGPANVSDGFVILPSGRGKRNSQIPPDAMICHNCLAELRSVEDRRFGFPFTNCTDCGARFSIISDIPYDRPLTTMGEFRMCPKCRAEYDEPGNRRFHAQTISCPDCGPHYSLFDADRQMVEGGTREFTARIARGEFGVLKGWGGSHIICTLAGIPEMRKWYGRDQKPFAIMARDIESARRYAVIGRGEERLLEGRARPIVLLKKKQEAEVLAMVSPGLDNVGIMLPYSAVHHILFSELASEDIDALVMTSANPGGEPMAIDEPYILRLGFKNHLLHNRRIANRCDDSLVIHHAGQNYFIRKSRGFVPEPIGMQVDGGPEILALGAQENLTAAVSSGGWIYPTQYIGNGAKYGVIEYLETAARHMMKLRGVSSVDAIAIDMHPGYRNRKLAARLSEEFDAPVHEFQHHWAHAASLLADARLDEAVVLTLDGTGYGDDGKAWGGEIMAATFSGYERLAHLQELPLLGGEAAVKDVRRLQFAVEEMLGRDSQLFSEAERQTFRAIKDDAPRTTSMGRVLDALSTALGICDRRTYDGEPAMKLEPWLDASVSDEYFLAGTQSGAIDTLGLFRTLFDLMDDGVTDRKMLASGFVRALVREMSNQAARAAQGRGIKHIGITGGVSYNIPVVDMFMHELDILNYDLVRHNNVPNGDGGISVGQCTLAHNLLLK